MTEYMSKKNYDKIEQLNKFFDKCLISCAQEISQITNDRELIGVYNEDSDLYEDRYLVQFESGPSCDPDHDSIYVPVEYLYNEGYREYYKKYLINERERKAQAILKREEYRKAHTYRIITDERAEYERLKLKFGD